MPSINASMQDHQTMVDTPAIWSEARGVCYQVPTRFVQAFRAHGVLESEIPALLGPGCGLEIADFTSPARLLEKIDERLIRRVYEMFGVLPAWIRGFSDQIYPSTGESTYDRHVRGFIKLLAEIDGVCGKLALKVIAVNTLCARSSVYQPVMLVIQAPAGNVSGREVPRYFPITKIWNWEYERTRFELKAILGFCDREFISLQGFVVPREIFCGINEGRLFPERLLDAVSQQDRFKPLAYAVPPQPSALEPAEQEEIEFAAGYIKEKGYEMSHMEFLEYAAKAERAGGLPDPYGKYQG